MSDQDQEALAAAWAAQLEEEEAEADNAQASADAALDNAAGGGLPSMDDLNSSDDDQEDMAARWAEALASSEEESTQTAWNKGLSSQASEAVFKDMTDAAKRPTPDGAKRELDFILDIPLDVSAELGRTRLLINELLQLGQGSVVELNKLAGEPLEIFVNGKLVARGEAVVINEKFGVRLTDIISPMERVKQLG